LISSSTSSAHLAPFNSDFSAGRTLCSLAGVMDPDGALLDCSDVGPDTPRAACAYENGTNGAAGLTASACDDDIVPKNCGRSVRVMRVISNSPITDLQKKDNESGTSRVGFPRQMNSCSVRDWGTHVRRGAQTALSAPPLAVAARLGVPLACQALYVRVR
jgi:hypothetical protein